MDDHPRQETRTATIGARIRRWVLLLGVPLVTITGIALTVRLNPAYPANVGIGVILFVLLWFWFRSLGRLLF